MSEYTFIVVTPEGDEEELLTVGGNNLRDAIYTFFIQMLVKGDTGVFQELIAAEGLYAAEGDTVHQPQDLIKAFDEGGR